MILAGFSYDPKICNFKFQNEFKMKLFRGFQGNALPPMKNLPAKNRELGNLIRAAIRMMLLDGHTELGF